MFFSIIVPVYNVENYLETCIQSILKQSFNDFELILIDDGSSDQSGLICDNYKFKYDSKIKVVHQPNRGSIYTRDRGLHIAAGEYIIFIDSDDYILKDALQVIYNAIQEFNVDIVIFDYVRENSKSYSINYLKPGIIYSKEQKDIIYRILCMSNDLNSLCRKAFKRTLVDNINYENYYELKRFNGEDLLISLPIIINSSSIVYINEPLYFYRINENSITRTNKAFYNDLKILQQYLWVTFYNIFPDAEILLWKWRLRSIIIHVLSILADESDLRKDKLLLIANDAFFRECYEKNTEKLTLKEMLISKFLYFNQITLLIRIRDIYYLIIKK